MANRIKEDEKNERIIRGLLKLPENKRCINCNGLGPQYVCTSFCTFVCTTCSGIHREFTHRVKSISMAKFTSQEVTALQGGGNQRAKEIYLKEWDPQRNSLPDGSNVDKLRDFIKHVYVDKRYSGDRSFDRPPRVKSDKEDSHHGGSRSPPYEEMYDRRYSDRSSSGGRSPAYDQESRQLSDYKRSPSRPDIINDWRREDRFGNGKKLDDRRTSDGESKIGGSPERPKDLDTSSPPVVRPVREILGDNVLPLRIAEPPKANGTRATDGLVQTQRTASSSSLGSTNGNVAEVKPEKAVSLIDFDADPEPPTTAATQPHPLTISQAVSPPMTSTSQDNWASFDATPATTVSQPPKASPLDSVISQLTTPAPAPGQQSGNAGLGGAFVAPGGTSAVLPLVGNSTAAPVGNNPVLPLTAGASTVVPAGGLSTFPQGGASVIAPGLVSTSAVSGGPAFSAPPQQPNLFPAAAGMQTTQPSSMHIHGASSNQSWNASPAANVQGPFNMVSSQAFHASKPYEQVASGVASQNVPAEVKSNSRKELPADLFTATYPSFPAPVMGWQTGPPFAMGYMQYNTVMTMQAMPQQSKSVNPFDTSEPSQVQTPVFPSMGSLQGALPNVPPSSSLMHAPSLGTPTPSWMPPQGSYAPAASLQPQPHTSALPPSAYMGQQMHGNMPPSRYQGVGGFGMEGASYGPLNTNQFGTAGFQAPHTSNSSAPVGGNPFG
ncbi:hypothetical protein BT93_C0633 [Corymbia citriodora subsp. variegata]|nr:hypothetical protein BT93_C0633 [Corymbia citriodora subsp. variegata]